MAEFHVAASVSGPIIYVISNIFFYYDQTKYMLLKKGL